MNLDNDIDTIVQILLENTSYSSQARVYVIHGAIEKLIQWRDSFLNKNKDMQTMMQAETPRMLEMITSLRQECYVIMHAHTIWKGFFFHSAEQAAGVLRDVTGFRFKSIGDKSNAVLVNELDGGKFYIKPLLQYTGMQDFQLPKA